MQFWNRFESLCQENGEKPTPLVKKLGIPAGSVTSWKNGSVPHHGTLLKIADYFGVTVDYLLGNEAKEKGATQMVAPITELSPREVQVALAYRSQDDAVKAAIDKMLDLPPLVEEGLA